MRTAALSAMILGLMITAASGQMRAGHPVGQPVPAGLRGAYFVSNQGQWPDAAVHFGLRSRGLDVALRESALTMHLARAIPGSAEEDPLRESLTLTVTFPGSNAVAPIAVEPLAAHFNYFVGGEGRGVASDVPAWGAVVYHDLYDGIDLFVTGSEDGILKYEFRARPGADCSVIRIAYDGIESLCINDAGDLRIDTLFGTLSDAAPIVWQPSSTGQTLARIPARFELLDARTYRIELDGPVDPNLPIVIDPDVDWMYYVGGSEADVGYAVATDDAGNALLTGRTFSPDFEHSKSSYYGENDAFVAMVSPDGQLLWMTYLGGSGHEIASGIALDSAGNALVTGDTRSLDFKGRNNSPHGGRDAFALKVDPHGRLLWMTYLGGTSVVGDKGHGIAVDIADNALVVGETYSTDFEGRINSRYGAIDGFALKVDSAGQLQWMRYLGGVEDDLGYSAAMDGEDSLITGYTRSPDFAGAGNQYHGGTSDGFALRINPVGELEWMIYLGGTNGGDHGSGLVVDRFGDVLIAGSTWSNNFEGRRNARHGGDGWDAFLVKLSSAGRLQGMTYLGGTGDDFGRGVARDRDDNAVVTGWTQSADFEGQSNVYHGGDGDAYLCKVDPLGQIQWTTYLGGEARDDGLGVAVDRAGNAVVTGETRSALFGGKSNEFHGGLNDAFIVKLHVADGPQLSADAACPSGGPAQVSWTGATGGGLAALVFGLDGGLFTLPPQVPCGGTTLGLGARRLQIAWTGDAGPQGAHSIEVVAGPAACGGYLQLLDVATCGTSNVVRIE